MFLYTLLYYNTIWLQQSTHEKRYTARILYYVMRKKLLLNYYVGQAYYTRVRIEKKKTKTRNGNYIVKNYKAQASSPIDERSMNNAHNI